MSCTVDSSLIGKINLGSPIIFKQERPGKNGRIFLLYKFRSMKDVRNKDGDMLPDEERMTTFGTILRNTSLDELPELINILKGDMSIIGPRPLLLKYLPLYNKHQNRRHEIRPGLTGLAQVNGRNSITWEERFEWDIKYIDNVTFLNDLSIILKTIKIVLLKEGINSKTSVTMEEFKGSNTR